MQIKFFQRERRFMFMCGSQEPTIPTLLSRGLDIMDSVFQL